MRAAPRQLLPLATLAGALALPLGAAGGVERSLLLVDEALLVHRGASDHERLGASVSIDGGLAAAGAPGDLDGTTPGEVHLFHRAGGVWSELQSLSSSSATGHDEFGADVELQGPRLVVGAPRESAAEGAAYVFDRVEAVYVESARLHPDRLLTGDSFGESVALDGGVLAVGAPRAGAGGEVHVYELIGGEWLPVQVLTPESPDPERRFGTSLALDLPRLVVGDPLARRNGEVVGTASVFVLVANGWLLDRELHAPDGQDGDAFGKAVDIDADAVLVGAPDKDLGFGPTRDDEGAAYVYRRTASEWSFEERLTALDRSERSRLGCAVAIESDRALVGSLTHRVGDNQESGIAYLFARQDDSWSETRRLLPRGATLDAEVGAAVDLSGELAILGAPRAPSPEVETGSAAVFDTGSLPAEPICFGDGGGSACPCGNESDARLGEGCRNWVSYAPYPGHGAALTAGGSASVSADDLILYAIQMPGNQTALAFAGTTSIADGSGVPFEHGLLCAGGVLRRLGVQGGQGSTVGRRWGPRLAVQLGVVPGDTRTLQVWYRSGGPCGGDSNTSNALSVTFAP